MRSFTDAEGREWVAGVEEREGFDYKGRFHLVFRRVGSPSEEVADLTDVRWNTARTAERTLRTMSGVELRRRLSSALGRGIRRGGGETDARIA